MIDQDTIQLFASIIKQNSHCFLVGNGINRYPDNSRRSWEDLLTEIRNNFEENHSLVGDRIKKFTKLERVPLGISLTEFYETLFFKYKVADSSVNELFTKHLDWDPGNHHIRFVNVCKKFGVPILTTNFDHTLQKASNSEKKMSGDSQIVGFSDMYPFQVYYSVDDLDDFNEFAIWHIQGDIRYKRSIKLSLRDYMNLISYVAKMLPEASSKAFEAKFIHSWINLFFKKGLIVFGLGLEHSETFLRWLLIKKVRFQKENNLEGIQNYYITIDEIENDISDGKRYFLESLNFKIIGFKKLKDFYEDFWQYFLTK